MAKKAKTVISESQTYCERVLTPEILGLIDYGTDSGIMEETSKDRATNHVKMIADLLFNQGVKWYMVTRKPPKDVNETLEDGNKRDELVRHIEDRMTRRMETQRPQMGAHVAFDLDGALKGINKKRKEDGKSKLTAREATADYGDIISVEMLDNRDLWSRTKSTWFKRIDQYLKAHEPKPVVDDSEGTGDAQETIEPVSEKTALQQMIDALNNAARYGRKDTTGAVADTDLGAIYALIGKLGGTADFDAE